MIRLAALLDMPELLRMGESFFNASGYSDLTTFNKDDTEDLLNELIGKGWLLTDGESTMLGFVVFPVFMNKSTIIAQELFWWVDENKRGSKVGVEILKRAEVLAKSYGATSLMMLSIEELKGGSVNKLYERLGYKRREQTYMRIL